MSTENKKDCACVCCVHCCESQPGWFLPGEAEKAAKLLGMTFEDFKNEYLTQEYWVDGADVLAPRKVCQPTGFKRARWGDAFVRGPCVFLTPDKKCRIHAAKPYECRTVYGCKGGSEHDNIREKIQIEWIKFGRITGKGR